MTSPGDDDKSASSVSPAEGLEVLGGILEIAREHLHLEEGVLPEPGTPLDSLASQQLLERRLVDDLGLDSIDLLTLAVEVEDRYQIILDEFETLAPPASGSPPVESSDSQQRERLDPEATRPSAENPVSTVGDLVALVVDRRRNAARALAQR